MYPGHGTKYRWHSVKQLRNENLLLDEFLDYSDYYKGNLPANFLHLLKWCFSPNPLGSSKYIVQKFHIQKDNSMMH